MKTTTRISKLFLFGTILFGMALSACQSEPKTDLERIDALKKQVQTDAMALDGLQDKEFEQLQKTFIACDSMLQYLHPETVDEVFEQLQLADAYLTQFMETQPLMRADMDSTIIQLDNLKSDIETQFITDSLARVYIEAETQHVDMLNNQVQYFKDRLKSSQKDLSELKKKM